MTRGVHAPPGRAGRLWLRRRLATAEQGARLLDHKLRLLRGERERLVLKREKTAAAWEAASLDARVWSLRAALLGGERAVRLSVAQTHADVQVDWVQLMGVRYPAAATFTGPDAEVDAGPTGNAAVVAAREAHRRALDAAVRHAAVEAALRVLDAEERSTRRRLRAIEERWVPRLRDALADLQLLLEEEEHADGVRLRWAARGLGPRRAG